MAEGGIVYPGVTQVEVLIKHDHRRIPQRHLEALLREAKVIFHALQPGDVGLYTVPHGAAVRQAARTRQQPHPANLPIGQTHARFTLKDAQLTRRGLDGLHEALLVVRMHLVEQQVGILHRVIGIDRVQPFHPGAEVRKTERSIRLAHQLIDQAVGQVVAQQPQALFAFTDLLLGALPVGDVHQRRQHHGHTVDGQDLGCQLGDVALTRLLEKLLLPSANKSVCG